MKEEPIGREKARKILLALDGGYMYDPWGDYFIVTNEEGEFLWQAGYDNPSAKNVGSISWAGVLPAVIEGDLID